MFGAFDYSFLCFCVYVESLNGFNSLYWTCLVFVSFLSLHCSFFGHRAFRGSLWWIVFVVKFTGWINWLIDWLIIAQIVSKTLLFRVSVSIDMVCFLFTVCYCELFDSRLFEIWERLVLLPKPRFSNTNIIVLFGYAENDYCLFSPLFCVDGVHPRNQYATPWH